MSRSINLHPLAITSSCDHYARVRMGGSLLPSNAPVIGLLYGNQKGPDLYVTTSTETVYTMTNWNIQEDEIKIDMDSVNKMSELMSQIDPTIELLGWYTFTDNNDNNGNSMSNEATQDHIKLHSFFMSIMPAPLFMLLDSDPKGDSFKIPVSVYEAEFHVIQGSRQLIFVDCAFHLESSQAESIAVEQVISATPSEGTTVMEEQAETMTTSLRNLQNEIRVLIQFLQNKNKVNKPESADILRRISQIVNQLNAVDSQDFDKYFASEMGTDLAVSNLAAITQFMFSSHDCCSKITAMNNTDYGGMGMRGKGMRNMDYGLGMEMGFHQSEYTSIL